MKKPPKLSDQVIEFAPAVLKIETRDCLALMKSGKSVSSEISALVDECRDAALRLAEPKGAVAFVEAGEGGIEIRSKLFSEIRPRAERLAVYLVTLGPAVPALIARKGAEDPGYAYFLDAAASVMTERLARLVHADVYRRVKESGLTVSHRFSPGVCDWDISGQRELFKIPVLQKIGVKLTETCLMVPEKSTSGVFAIGPEKDGKILHKSPCPGCEKQATCGYKRGNLREETLTPCSANTPSSL